MVKSGKYEVKQPNIFGRIGTGLGKGLAESLPKEMDRGRLSAGLKQFEKNSANLSPIQAATQLLSIPGISAEHIYALQPLLQQARARKAAADYGKSFGTDSNLGMGQNQSGQTPSQREQIPSGQISRGGQSPKAQNIPERSVTNLETERALTQPNLPPSQQKINALAGQLVDQYPDRFLTPQEAQTEASNLLSSDYNRNEALRAQSKVNDQVKSDIENEFNKSLSNYRANILGEEHQNLLNQAYKDVGSGNKTKLQAAQDAGKEGLKLAEGITKLDGIGQEWFPNAESAKNSIEQLRKTKFKDNPKLFYNKLQSTLGLTPGFAKNLSNPPSDNPAYSNFLKSVKTENLGGKAFLKNQADGYPREIKVADDLVKHLKSNDSILAGLVHLRSKGYDSNAIQNRVRDLFNSGKISLSDPQQEELEERPSTRPSIGDMWFMIMSGFEKLVGE